MSITSETVKGLETIGYVEDRGRSRKYRVFVKEGAAWRVLVGKSGALRRTRGSISDSVSITGTRFHKCLREIGKQSYPSPEIAEENLHRLLTS